MFSVLIIRMGLVVIAGDGDGTLDREFSDTVTGSKFMISGTGLLSITGVV